MDLSNLNPAQGSTFSRKRIGRGPGSGKGGTSTRGPKGAKQRSGSQTKVGFAGGQMPLQRRVPKFGFKHFNRVEYTAINLEMLHSLAASKKLQAIDMEVLMAAGLVSSKQKVKILGKGALSLPLTVTAHAFSKTAEAASVAAGGTAVKL